MGWFRIFIDHPRRKAAAGLVLAAFFAAQAHAQLGTPPFILFQPTNATVQLGKTAIISATVTPSLTPQNFYWFFNGRPIATNANITVSNAADLALDIISVLVISQVSSSNAGVYSLRITNGIGSAISSNATLTVPSSPLTNTIRFVSSGITLSASGFQLDLSGPSGSNYVIQASSDLRRWISISTNPAPAGSASYLDVAAMTNRIRFYRAYTQ